MVRTVVLVCNEVYTGMELGFDDGAVQYGKDIVASNVVKENIEKSRLMSVTVGSSIIKNCPVTPLPGGALN